eukprot:1472266-Rhodomonas_salina.1
MGEERARKRAGVAGAKREGPRWLTDRGLHRGGGLRGRAGLRRAGCTCSPARTRAEQPRIHTSAHSPTHALATSCFLPPDSRDKGV